MYPRKGSWNPNLYLVGQRGSKRLETCSWLVKLGQSSGAEIMMELNYESPSWYLQGNVEFFGEETHDLGVRQVSPYSKKRFFLCSLYLSVICRNKSKTLNK